MRGKSFPKIIAAIKFRGEHYQLALSIIVQIAHVAKTFFVQFADFLARGLKIHPVFDRNI